MAYKTKAREKEVENRLRKDYFQEFDAEEVLGDIDFAVAIPSDNLQLNDREYLLWAEAKKSNTHDINESLVQLILTIGKARTFENHLPPAFLGAFDAEKIAFIPYSQVIDVFYLSYINWNVRPSDHDSETFLKLFSLVKESLEKNMLIFTFDSDEKLLRQFIKKNFVSGKSKISKVRINKTNFTAIFQKWLSEVKPTINVNWEKARKQNIIPADFYLADILSKDNNYLRESLHVLLCSNHYEVDREIDDSGFFNSKTATFNDDQKAHIQFWNRYDRPPRREFWDDIEKRRDLLVPQDIREIKGSFFTPAKWVSLSQEYLAREFGENWQEEYYIWDCAAGTGNLLANLTNKYNIWASTIDKADVKVMHDRIKTMNEASGSKKGANLLDSHVFQFDFLNDSFDKLPPKLKEIIDSEEECKKLIIYINPPYAEASNGRAVSGTGSNRPGLSDTYVKRYYSKSLGRAANELFAQFFARAVKEINGCHVAMFSTLKILLGPNFIGFRNKFPARLSRTFLVPASTFDNVNGTFPIGFQIWHSIIKEEFESITADVYNAQEILIGKKKLYSFRSNELIIDWLRNYFDNKSAPIVYLRFLGTDFQHNNGVFLTLSPSATDIAQVKGHWMTYKNIVPMCVYYTARHFTERTWINNQDQYFYPSETWQSDAEFQGDCVIYTLFHDKNRISCKHGVNHFIPFTEKEVDAKDNFESHFMTDYMKGKVAEEFIKPKKTETVDGDLQFEEEEPVEAPTLQPLTFSETAKTVLAVGRELWRYYHQQTNALPDASLYDIRLHFQGTKTTAKGKEQMNTESDDPIYMALIKELRQGLAYLAKKIEPKIYEYGFLKRNYDSMVREAVQTDFMTAEVAKAPQKPKETTPPFFEEAEVDMKKPEVQPITVNIINNNTFERPVGAVIVNGSDGDIKDIIEIKKEE